MREKDHIENYFKKHLEHYEESPDDNFWARVSPAIEVQQQNNNYKILWLLLLLLSLLLTGFLMGNINWKQEIELEREMPIVADDLFLDTLISTENRITIIQKEENQIDKEAQKTVQNFTKEKSNFTSKVPIIKPLTKVTPKGEILSESMESVVLPNLEQQALELLPSKVAEFSYIAPELPTLRRPLRIQPYVSLHSYQLQSVTYEGIRQIDGMTTDRILLRPTNTIFNLGLDAGVILNEQFYLQIGFNQNYSLFTHTETINKSLDDQDIAILFDGVPINFDFTMDAYFDEIEGKLKLTPKTTEIEAGEKSFSVTAMRKMNTNRWTFSTAYKIDVSNIVRLTPKIGISKVKTKFKSYDALVSVEIPNSSSGQVLENQLNVEVDRTSINEEIQLENIEAIFGFQAEIPLGKRRKWLLVPSGELWFDWTSSSEQSNLTLKKSMLTLGVGMRYTVN